jgi:hypothetical protein
MNQIKESYGTEIININDVFQLKLVEGYYYKPQFIKKPNKSINGILFRDYREYDSWEIIWSLLDNRMDVGVTMNNRNSINQLIEQQIENNKTK